MSTLYLDIIFIVILAFLRSRSWNWWSHPWNLWVSLARIRLYCRILWFYPLLSVPQPIPQCATRFESFTIWWLLRPDFFFPPRFRRSCLTIWPILQISWPWFGASKRLHRISSSRRCQNSNQSNRSTDSYVCIITQKNRLIANSTSIVVPVITWTSKCTDLSPSLCYFRFPSHELLRNY